MKFFTHYDRPEKILEMNDGKTLVEMAGYIPAKIQIENMILAGQRLEMSRKELYDFDSERPVDFNFHDRTRDPNFDMSDAHQLTSELEQKRKKAQLEVAEKIKKNAAAKADVGQTDPTLGKP